MAIEDIDPVRLVASARWLGEANKTPVGFIGFADVLLTSHPMYVEDIQNQFDLLHAAWKLAERAVVRGWGPEFWNGDIFSIERWYSMLNLDEWVDVWHLREPR